METILSSRMVRVMLVAMAAVGLGAGAAAQEAAKIDTCGLLSKDEIQAAVGQKVSESKLAAGANPAIGAPCQYVVGDYGAFSILAKTAGPGETADKMKAEMEKRKIAVSEAPGIGDRSFYSSPGYGMIQLNTFRGPHYILITILVPGASEAAQKAAAGKLMGVALARL